MLEPKDRNNFPSFNPSPAPPATTTTNTAPRTNGAPLEQATIGRTLVIKGEVHGAEPLFIDGRVEGSISLNDNRVTIGRNGVVAADISAKEVVIMGKVDGNIICTDRIDIRSEGSLTGDVTTPRISVEDGAFLKGGIDIQKPAQKSDKPNSQAKAANEPPKAAAATAGMN
jgi:cytoskeletal protein CcmA (bactofilin family)